MNRVALAIRSNLPDEMDWALQSLVRMSFETPDDLHFDRYPALAPALVEKLNLADQFRDIDTYTFQTDAGEVITTDDDIGLFGATAASEKVRKQLDKVLEAALVLRNAAINPENARHLSRSKVCVDALVKCLTLPPDRPSLVELRQYCLDIVESVALFLRPTSSQDSLFRALVGYLSSDDRGVLISALRAIARLVINVEANLLQAVDRKVVARICALILLEDEELLSVCLDFLYQYTAAPENIELTGEVVDWQDPVQQLIRLLLYQAQEWPQKEARLTGNVTLEKKPPPSQPPELPNDLVHELLSFPEPERATQWMRACFEEDPDGDVTQIALWKAYETRFEEYVKQGKKLLPAADFIKNVTTAFRRAAAMVVTLPGGQQKFIIKGIRPREVPKSLKGELYLKCQWTSPTPNWPRCTGTFPSVKDLYSHILSVHIPSPHEAAPPPGQQPVHQPASTVMGLGPIPSLPPPTTNGTAGASPAPAGPPINGTPAQPADTQMTDAPPPSPISAQTSASPPPAHVHEATAVESAPQSSLLTQSSQDQLPVRYFCHWNGCTRFSPNGDNDRRKVISHFKTHIPDPDHNKPLPYNGRSPPPQTTASGTLTLDTSISSQNVVLVSKLTTVDEHGEATGIPLTSCLILRNVARSETGKRLLGGLETELIGVAAVNTPLRNYIADLLDVIEEKRRTIE
ncbi:hypothetical protein POJ06DRAFT_202607 [Lipomyces tetrasporus]|uniref:RFX-type winged-helix domain-containing protein n=1 Tax=Lipomyces tetrasporus TaxID=54092 RepID=A0AAD7QM74_9ASCO|nr:uncharacterized protein POJ06DRAFT_202607 [Lipomyces tetrasporus]KAJ8097461.1 hypothetical protein POJ06DRAFT_202607 [Lipomyces tetrasporus]